MPVLLALAAWAGDVRAQSAQQTAPAPRHISAERAGLDIRLPPNLSYCPDKLEEPYQAGLFTLNGHDLYLGAPRGICGDDVAAGRAERLPHLSVTAGSYDPGITDFVGNPDPTVGRMGLLGQLTDIKRHHGPGNAVQLYIGGNYGGPDDRTEDGRYMAWSLTLALVTTTGRLDRDLIVFRHLVAGVRHCGETDEPACAPEAPLPACAHDRVAMLALAPDAFDQGPAGWRAVGQKPGCETNGADLIAAYRAAHPGRVNPGDLIWHEAQLRAMGGDYASAIRLIQAQPNDPYPENRLYDQATLAFLQGDQPALLGARRALAALPETAEFAQAAVVFKAKGGRDLKWPPNLDVVDGLIACFGQPYARAYSMACRPK